MIASTINLTIFIMMIIIYLNEMRNISMFIFNFNYIKDLSKIIMEQKCNNIYCEAETDRYQIAKNSYNLRMPNDIFNSKTYTIFVFIISILVFIYYHYILFDNKTSSKSYYVLNILLLIILLTIIIYRYVPNDDAGYLNYFKDTSSTFSNGIIVISLGIIGAILITYVNVDSKNYNTYICYVISIIVLLNLMNIVMSFRSNTKPMLKTKSLLWSIKKSIDNYVNNSDMSYTDGAKKTLTYIGDDLKEEIGYLRNLIEDKKYMKTTKTNIAYYMKILIAFKELSKIYSKSLSNDTEPVKGYIATLKKDIVDNVNNIKKDDKTTEADADISELSLIFDKEINLPITYNGNEHIINANTANAEYVYTADISYDNPNLFYEKYWDMNEIGNNWFIIIPQFLYRYDYFTPTYLFGGWRPNLFKILMLIIVSIVVLLLIDFVLKSFAFIQDSEIFKNILPLFMLAILILFIISFISFNTWFNKYVVYKCLDSSYKRSLNKLNNITTPYIRLYDNKIVNGNKNYLRNYIITNVFYSLLNGNIKLNDDTKINKVYEAIQATTETQTMMRQMIKLIIGLSVFYDKDDKVPIADDNLSIFNSKRTEVTDKITASKVSLESIDTHMKDSKMTSADETITSKIKTITDAIANIIKNISGEPPINSVKTYIDTKTLASDTSALKLAKQAEIDLSKILTNIEELKTILLKAADTASEAINSKDDYYNIPKIKSSRLQFTNINSGILSDENGFRDYYKGTFKDIYDVKHEPANVTKLYKVFEGLFPEPTPLIATIETHIDDYFRKTIIKIANIKNIYFIIKKCFNMFDENKFNSNLAYYNDAENKKKGINIISYNKFSFQKYNNKIIPYKFVLKLDTTSARDEFTKDLSKDEETEFDTLINDFLDDTDKFIINTTKILDNSEEDLLNQASDIEKKQNKNLIKIIAKYLLILGHINYNRIEYVDKASTEQKEIYEKKTYNLYKLISDTLYNDTYDIDDTFKTTGASTLLITDTYKRYKNLTYIYNYLETKYVSISSNNNNSNYLMNIIKSINNKINDDDKTFKNVSKDAKYLFRDYIDRKDNKEDYENEEEILTIANNISTTTLGGTYIFNIILLIIVVNILK